MFKGILHFHSETGTEGGFWAFQDEQFMGLHTEGSDNALNCAKCGRIKSKDEPDPAPLPRTPEDSVWFPAECGKDNHDWRPMYPEGMWSYEGLHVLHDGDYLTVYSPTDPGKVEWQGTIDLKQFPLFTEDAGGLWIHAEQRGIDRLEWARMFFQEWPAELEAVA
jgi:hypothetical protein